MSSLENAPKKKPQEDAVRSDCPLGDNLLHSFATRLERPVETCAGSLGVRGFISQVAGLHHEDRVLALDAVLTTLKKEGVQRVHTIIEPGEALESAALAVGFGPCPGETLFQRDLSSPPLSTLSLASSFILRDGTLRDLALISNSLTHIQELAFHGWEKLLIGRHLQRSDRFFKVIEHDTSIVGISIGGSYEERGTISHTWVAPEHRNHRLGQALTDSSLSALYEGGARIVHLMTTPANVSAERFWDRQGFVRESSAYFLEKDL